ncbi:telomere repeat-binding 2-like [Olea europaea subsp. europaea]|uniref:Telomere repeat-binding 2-like n=1 Tax=Olea europaea subsp. europaea TaxID=158383 RepID=A0A8S0V5T7_OLEEU|nr:telomere repeat-binding 2-like [Olea europaea subsp. europaea]
MDIDPDISNWILEFLLKQPLQDSILNFLVSNLPLPNNNPILKKSLLLKKLEFEISHNSAVSETTLEHLEQLEELESRKGVERVSDTMKCAYWQIAVECSVKYLKKEVWKKSKYDFFKSLKSVWWGRVGKLEKVENGGLGSEELFAWRDEMDNAFPKKRARKRLVKKSKGVNAVEALRVYLKEEREKMGPSFLELVAHRFKDEETMKEVLGLGNANGIVPNEPVLRSADQDSAAKNNNGVVQKDASLQRSSDTFRGAEVVDSDCLAVQPLLCKYDLPPTPEVTRVQEALESSRLDLQANVKDPLPDALRRAEVITGKERGSTDHEPIKENHVSPNPSAVNGAGVITGKERGSTDHEPIQENHVSPNPSAVNGVVRTDGGNPSNRPRPSLMERNSTAHTHEWDESNVNSLEDSTDRVSRPKLPSPKRRLVSPLKKTGKGQTTKRRRVGKWSAEEEDTLRAGVEEYGQGNWKCILKAYRHIFEGRRTEVDLKDKWRNMNRY